MDRRGSGSFIDCVNDANDYNGQVKLKFSAASGGFGFTIQSNRLICHQTLSVKPVLFLIKPAIWVLADNPHHLDFARPRPESGCRINYPNPSQSSNLRLTILTWRHQHRARPPMRVRQPVTIPPVK